MFRCPYIYTSCPGRYPSKLAELVPLPYCRKRDTSYSNWLYNFFCHSFQVLGGDFCNSYFSHMARLWNSLFAECFLLTYDQNDFKSRVNKHLLPVGFLCGFHLGLFYFLLIPFFPFLAMAGQSCME